MQIKHDLGAPSNFTANPLPTRFCRPKIPLSADPAEARQLSDFNDVFDGRGAFLGREKSIFPCRQRKTGCAADRHLTRAIADRTTRPAGNGRDRSAESPRREWA